MAGVNNASRALHATPKVVCFRRRRRVRVGVNVGQGRWTSGGDCRRETRVWSGEDKCAQRREPPAQSEGNVSKRNSVNSDIEVSPSFKSVACCTC